MALRARHQRPMPWRRERVLELVSELVVPCAPFGACLALAQARPSLGRGALACAALAPGLQLADENFDSARCDAHAAASCERSSACTGHRFALLLRTLDGNGPLCGRKSSKSRCVVDRRTIRQSPADNPPTALKFLLDFEYFSLKSSPRNSALARYPSGRLRRRPDRFNFLHADSQAFQAARDESAILNLALQQWMRLHDATTCADRYPVGGDGLGDELNRV